MLGTAVRFTMAGRGGAQKYYVWIIFQRAAFFLLTCHIYVTFTTPPPP